MLPTFPTAVPAVAPGIEPRFRALAGAIKKHASYNPSIGEALGIEGDVQSGPDMATIQPELAARIASGIVEVQWGWGGQSRFLDACEIEVDRGTGSFTLLVQDTTPDYNDTHPFPATPTKWTYRAIYRVGQWSQTVGVVVG